jgi:hypothetical protein
MEVANTLAYYDTATIIVVKSFIVQAPGFTFCLFPFCSIERNEILKNPCTIKSYTIPSKNPDHAKNERYCRNRAVVKSTE